jgi:hypothetical protein
LTERVELAGLSISDSPERWAALGFAVDDVGETIVGAVRLRLGIAPPGQGIVSWELTGPTGSGDLDGLATAVAGVHRRPPGQHANGALGVDHVVITCPDFDGFVATLDARGMGLRRTAERGGRRQGFRRLGGPIMEIVEAPEAPAPAFWGLTFTVRDLDALVARGRFVGEPRDAVQPGRRIATVSREAGLSTRVAFMDPEPEPSPRS